MECTRLYHSHVSLSTGAFSLFNLVQFKSVECKATASENGGAYSGLMGTCLTSTECSDRGGSKKGNCASGFGVCCVSQLKACGGTIKHVSQNAFCFYPSAQCL